MSPFVRNISSCDPGVTLPERGMGMGCDPRPTWVGRGGGPAVLPAPVSPYPKILTVSSAVDLSGSNRTRAYEMVMSGGP